MDPFSGSPDALLYVYFANDGGSYVKIGGTNNIPDDNDPDWSERYSLDYTGGYAQVSFVRLIYIR